ncbi:MAG: hypothetical protein PHU95_07740 [Candidatus Thermoplasmatota archaeon]|nr:hypothetical protein [Candidatus Thermoplasmatota archaeon]
MDTKKRYQPIMEIGRGAMGEVYLGTGVENPIRIFIDISEI